MLDTPMQHERRFPSYILLGDTPRVATRIFKQNFKIKFKSRKLIESKNTKAIAWQHFFK
jgi:hypothetical protein